MTQRDFMPYLCIMYHVKLSHGAPQFGNFDQRSCPETDKQKENGGVSSKMWYSFVQDMLSLKELSLGQLAGSAGRPCDS